VVMFGKQNLGNLFPVLPVLVGVYFLTRRSKEGSDPGRARAVPFYCGAALLVLGAVLFFSARNQVKDSVAAARNFYGVLTVKALNSDQPDWQAYALFHGRIAHGYQFLTESKRDLPSGYYGLTSGVGLALVGLQVREAKAATPQNLRIGVVGLGVGTLASYGRAGDYIRFYEINPEVTRIANEYFTYLKDCRASLEVIPGDARLSMEREVEHDQSQHFDLLAIDAFSGDAIPVHLLTQEAFQIYLKQINPDGIIAVHITNTYFDLRPVLWRIAERFKLHYRLLHTDGDGAVTTYSDWMLLSPDNTFLDSLPPSTGNIRGDALKPDAALWTDDYSNLFWVLRK